MKTAKAQAQHPSNLMNLLNVACLESPAAVTNVRFHNKYGVIAEEPDDAEDQILAALSAPPPFPQSHQPMEKH